MSSRAGFGRSKPKLKEGRSCTALTQLASLTARLVHSSQTRVIMSLHTSSCPHQSAPACTNRPGCVNLSGQALVLPVLPVHISQATRTVRRHLRSSRSLAQARQICLAGKVSEGWWKQYPELWEEVGTEQEFDSILTQHDDKLLLVDFWGKV